MSEQLNSAGEGSVSLRKDGRWQARLQVGGQRRTVYAESKAEVRKKLFELQRQANGGILPNPGSRTVNDLLSLWLETTKKSLKPTTVAWYETIANKHIRSNLGTVRLSRLQPTHLQRLYAKLDGRIAKAVHGVLHRACKLAVMWRWLDSNPADNVLPPSYSPPRKEVWTQREMRHFLDGTAEHWLSPLWTVATLTGCRIGELLALKWADADLENGGIHIRSNLQRVRGEWLESSPKTKAGERRISLAAKGIAALRRQRMRQAEWKLRAQEWQDGALVFTGDNGRPIHRSTVSHAMSRECRRLRLPAVSPHGLRHLHASLLLREGISVPAVAARLGHSRPSITMSIYAHELGDEDHEAAEAIGKMLAN